jgi:hypothetical protein
MDGKRRKSVDTLYGEVGVVVHNRYNSLKDGIILLVLPVPVPV